MPRLYHRLLRERSVSGAVDATPRPRIIGRRLVARGVGGALYWREDGPKFTAGI
ncbi:MAG: hypothetical protein IKF72_05900 [Kiritimatiellae bacterium]|nr:hypothetical protein [Kiritimatiellia bacterium]